MPEIFRIKRNDQVPRIEIDPLDGRWKKIVFNPSDIQGVKFFMRKDGETTLKVDGVGGFDSTTERFFYEWSGSDTDEGGRFKAEFEVTLVGGKIVTFPNSDDPRDELIVLIADDLG